MRVLNYFRQCLVYLGYPWFLLLKTGVKILRKLLSLLTTHLPLSKKTKILYRSPRNISFKDFLKKVYPLVAACPQFSIPTPKFKLAWPQLNLPKLPKFRFKPPQLSFKFTMPTVRYRWFVGIFVVAATISFVYFYVFKDLPSPTTLSTNTPPLTTHIRDRNGVELYKIYHDQNRTLVSLSDIPMHLRQATIAIEDAEFYSHAGFSIRGTLRAISKNISSGRILEGGSTLTQQLVKSALLSPEKTLRRKLRELILALAVELKYTKDEILEMYLNRVGYGGTAYGIEEAAQTYFGKQVNQLSLAEGALLAGLPASPTTFSPFGAHPELAKQRQKEVLRRMVDEGFITWEQAEAASLEELSFSPPQTNIKAPHFVMYVKEALEKKYGTYVVEQGGLEVFTSLDWNLQQEAEKAVTEETAKIAYLHIGNGSALVTNPNTGEILAMVGSRNYFDTKNDGQVNVSQALRQPGSSIKPINYALALLRGFNPASIIDDSPITYKTAGQPPYSPVNYDGKYHGKVSLRTALASSYNIPAVKLLSANGVANMIQLGQKMGITTWADTSRFGLSLTLGGGEVKMTDMAVAYGVFANYGVRVDLQPILLIKNNRGKVLEKFTCKDLSFMPTVHAEAEAATEITSCQGEPVLDPAVTYLISDILSDNAARTPAFGPRSDLFIPGSQVAVKTGTTNNLRDNWTIGYTPNRLVAVWVGNNDNSPMSYVASGVTGASPIWKRIMTTVLKTTPSLGFVAPTNLVQVNVCTITGELSCTSCPSKIEYFLSGTEPKKACTDENILRLQQERSLKEQQERDRLLTGIAVEN